MSGGKLTQPAAGGLVAERDASAPLRRRAHEQGDDAAADDRELGLETHQGLSHPQLFTERHDVVVHVPARFAPPASTNESFAPPVAPTWTAVVSCLVAERQTL